MMKRILTMLGLLLLTSCATVRDPELRSKHSSNNVDAVRRQLAAVDLGEVSFRPAHVADAILFWMGATQERDPQHRGVSAVFTGYGHSISGSAAPLVDANANLDAAPTVTLKTHSISSLEFLNEICRQADLVWWMTPKSIIIVPRKDMNVEPRPVP